MAAGIQNSVNSITEVTYSEITTDEIESVTIGPFKQEKPWIR